MIDSREVLGPVGFVPRPSDVEDPSVAVAVDCIPPGPSDVEDPSLGVTDGGILG